MNENDSQLIQRIAQRASDLYKEISDADVAPSFIASEIWMVHEHIVRLRLQEMLDADDGNFAHDVAGIHRHLDIKKVPVLTDGFYPRFAKT